jgi:hypothetical protein
MLTRIRFHIVCIARQPSQASFYLHGILRECTLFFRTQAAVIGRLFS